VWTSDRALLIGWTVLLVSAIALTVGWHSRLAALAVLLLTLSFEWRNPSVFNSGDNLFRIEALFVAMSPCGAALSLDRRRATGSFWSAQIRAPWVVRLMQVQLSLIYLTTVRVKMSGQAWPNGTAVSYALRLQDMLIIRTPHWFTSNALLMNAATWGTLAVELAIGILVWNHRLRPWVLATGVLMHSTILITIGVGFFVPAMFVLYLAFIAPDTVQRLLTTIKHVDVQSLPLFRRSSPTTNDPHKGTPERREVDNDSPTGPPVLTPLDWIKPDEPRGDQTVGTSPITNGADLTDGPTQLVE
jgi:hypothetical protein